MNEYVKTIRAFDRYRWMLKHPERAAAMLLNSTVTDMEQEIDQEIEAARLEAKKERDRWLREELTLLRGERS